MPFSGGDDKAENHDYPEEMRSSDDRLPQYSTVDDSLQQHKPSIWTAVANDGRIDVDGDSELFRAVSRICTQDIQKERRVEPATGPPPALPLRLPSIKLNICIQVVGSRGDVQPFVALGTELARRGHRVRIATHVDFEFFVHDASLEFFSIGGSPAELMAFMVKNPGLIPDFKSLRAGDVQKKRRMIALMLDGLWKSCISPDTVSERPFIADAIIANPVGFAHVHCAQALGVPLHMAFTMPWTSTRAFPHPLVNLLSHKSVAAETANYVSYRLADWIHWQGLGDVINDWRQSIDLEPVPRSEGHRLLDTLQVPFTYCWSPALVPKPNDWPNHVDICGFLFRQAPEYTPSSELEHFLESGSPPIYIGFGSIVVQNADRLTDILLHAIKNVGCRAIISKGWSRLEAHAIADMDVLFLDDCPHEWLFQRIAAVVHHGGAGTTACGLLNGLPTVIVPFFGDQPFWGKMVADAGAGPNPIRYEHLNSNNLTEAIKFCLSDAAKAAAWSMGVKMREERGIRNAVDSFLFQLPEAAMQCDILSDEVACWSYNRGRIGFKLSRLAAEVLVERSVIQRKHLVRYESKPIVIENNRWDPLTALASSFLSTSTGMATSAVGILWRPIDTFIMASRRSRERQSATNGTNTAIIIDEHQQSPFLKATLESVASVGGVLHHFSKGFLVDMPIAVTEGLRAVPKLYGGEIPNQGRVTDWKSGLTVAARNLSHGVTSGISDLYNEPVKGAAKEGIAGSVLGAGKGCISLVTKIASGGVGLVAYPGLGLMKTVNTAIHGRRRAIVVRAAQEQGQDDLMRAKYDPEGVVKMFHAKLEAATSLAK